MDKKKQMNFNLNGFLISTSLALDYVQFYKKKTALGHSKRVSYIALNIGIALNLKPEELADLCAYSLCHNIGLNQSSDDKSYCEISNEYVKNFPFLTDQDEILRYQKENYDSSGVYGLKGEEIPLLSQILYLAVFLDESFDLVNANVQKRDEIIEFVQNNSEILFSSRLVEIFTNLTSNISFWLDLKNEQDLIMFIYGSLHDFTYSPTFQEVLDITKVFSSVENPDSRLIELTEKMSKYYNFEHKDDKTLQIASSLSKIGKLMIDTRILNKNDVLDEYELREVQSYPYYTRKILFTIMGFNDIASWAIKIQERPDGSGYCFGFDGKNLSLKDRLLATLNSYDSLTLEKPYRKAYSHDEAIEILKTEANNKKYDLAIVEDLDRVLK